MSWPSATGSRVYSSLPPPGATRPAAAASGSIVPASDAPVRSSDTLSRDSSPWRSITQIGAVTMLVGFFLPWVSVSCAGVSVVTLSGYQLASGTQIDTGAGIQQVGGAADLWWLVVAAVAALVLAIAVRTRKTAAVLSSFAGAAGFIDLLAVYRSFQERSSALLSVTPEAGFWVSLVGLLLIVVGGAIGLG